MSCGDRGHVMVGEANEGGKRIVCMCVYKPLREGNMGR